MDFDDVCLSVDKNTNKQIKDELNKKTFHDDKSCFVTMINNDDDDKQ